MSTCHSPAISLNIIWRKKGSDLKLAGCPIDSWIWSTRGLRTGGRSAESGMRSTHSNLNTTCPRWDIGFGGRKPRIFPNQVHRLRRLHTRISRKDGLSRDARIRHGLIVLVRYGDTSSPEEKARLRQLGGLAERCSRPLDPPNAGLPPLPERPCSSPSTESSSNYRPHPNAVFRPQHPSP